MKNGLVVINAVLLIAVAWLVYKQIGSRKDQRAVTSAATHDTSTAPGPFRIAYFEMDSVEANYEMVKDVKAELSKKQDAMNSELNKMDHGYRDKVNEYQGKAKSMSQVQSEAATQDLMKAQDDMKTRKQTLEQEYNDFGTRRMMDIKNKIEEFLQDYNKGRTYSYIVSYEQGLFYYRDSAYNITRDVIKGLNELYKRGKH